MFYFFLSLTLFSSIAQGSNSNAILARVNGEAIYKEELQKIFPDLKFEEALDRMVLYRLAIQQAKETGLDRTHQVQEKIDRLLYESYLENIAQKLGQSLIPKEGEIEAYYTLKPFIKVKHLYLAAEKKLAKVKALLSAKTPFSKIILKYSDDPSLTTGGISDLRCEHDLPPGIYSSLIQAKTSKEVIGPIMIDTGYHFFQLVEVVPFAKLPENSKKLVENGLRKENELTRLKIELTKLKEKSKIVILTEK